MSRYSRLILPLWAAAQIVSPVARANDCLLHFSCAIGGECRLPCLDSSQPRSAPVDLHRPDLSTAVDVGSSPPPQPHPLQAEAVGHGPKPVVLRKPSRHDHGKRSASSVVFRAKAPSKAGPSPLPGHRIFAAEQRERPAASPVSPSSSGTAVPPNPTVPQPVSASPGRHEQRASLAVSVGPPRRPVGKRLARVEALLPPDKAASPAAEAKPGPIDLQSLGRGLAPNISIAGVQPTAADVLDGPITPDEAETPRPPAVPKQPPGKAKALLDVEPSDQHTDLFADPNPPGASIAPAQTPPAHPKIFDVSEGTRLDPLKNKNYDLNSGKDIPSQLLGK